MKIDRHISELLYNHDCVIVPSFGGFLASYQSAQLQPAQHTFFPPSKKIAFNVFLKNNDGLLANYIAHKHNISYGEALSNIERFRIEAISLLDSGKKIIIEDVGTLFYDQDRNLQFEADKHVNYLEEAFGLTAVQSPPVKREEQRKKIERQIRQAVSLRSSVKPAQVKTHGRTNGAWKVFNTVVLSGALLWFSFNVYLITPHHVNISSLNPFSYSSSEKSETSASTPNTNSVASPAQIQKEADSIDKMLPDKQLPSDNSLAANVPAKKEEAAAPTAAIQSEKNFYLIAGVFREAGNAEKLVGDLKQEGYKDAEILNPEASAKKVSYSSFSSHAEAAAALEQLHAAKKDGWIMKK